MRGNLVRAVTVPPAVLLQTYHRVRGNLVRAVTVPPAVLLQTYHRVRGNLVRAVTVPLPSCYRPTTVCAVT